MKKLAFFVEGQTEQLFIKKLLTEIAGTKNIEIKESKPFNKTQLRDLIGKSLITNKEYYVLLIDCGSDSKVKSDLIDSYNGLIKKNYTKVLGLMDIHPKLYSELPKIKAGIKYGMPNKIPTNILLSVSEIEAWFMAEYLHFEKIHRSLTHQKILSDFSHDLINGNAEKIVHPAKQLNDIYVSVGTSYKKNKKSVTRTVNALDFTNIYVSVQNKVPHLKELISHIDSFLT